MNDVVVFVANGFCRENIRLQPWRYILEIAKQRGKGRSIVIVSDGDTEKEVEQWDSDFFVIKTRFLNIKTQKQLSILLQELKPTELWWSTTPRTIAFYRLLSKVDCRLNLFMTCPLYTWKQLIRAVLIARVPFRQTKALLLQRFIPRYLLRLFLNKTFIQNVFVQSNTNLRILESINVNKDKVSVLPVGIDSESCEDINVNIIDTVKSSLPDNIDDSVVFLYFGALRKIRGFNALLHAIPKVVENNETVHFVILARGATEEKCTTILEALEKQGIKDRVTIIGGWLTKEEVRAYVEISDVAVLPFILVPSDIPIAALEALARGKPIIVSPVDGLPDMAAGRGIVVDPLNRGVFASTIIQLAEDTRLREELNAAANRYMASYPRWQDLGDVIEQSV